MHGFGFFLIIYSNADGIVNVESKKENKAPNVEKINGEDQGDGGEDEDTRYSLIYITNS